jgi:allantoinase
LSVADGDERNESIYDIVEPVEGVPNFCLASHFDYGPRVGYWRIMRMLERFDVPCTVSAAGRAVERSPWLAKDAVARGHEIACHGYRWERHAEMAEAHEREVIAKTVACIRNATGSPPRGLAYKGCTVAQHDDGCSWRRAVFSTIRTPMMTICPIWWRSRGVVT